MKRITLLFLITVSMAFGQFTLPNAVPLPQPKTQVLDHLGRACSGCLLWTYAAGTSTPQATYTDSSGSTPNTNPIVLDTAGAANIWIGALSYKLTLERPPVISGHGVPLWTVDNVSDVTFNYISYLKTITDSALLSYRNPLNGAVDRTVRDKLAESVSVKDFGAKGDGVTDDAAAIQLALNLPGPKRIVFPAGTYLISKTLWVHSQTAVAGEGGRSRATTIKRKDGMYTDAFVTGIWDGGTHPRSTYITWDGGYPYNVGNLGDSISFTGIHIDGNGANAGQPPAFPSPPGASYRGSNIWVQWVSGVLLDDVFSEHASNDNAFIASSRRVTVVNSTFSDNILINPLGGDTRNGLTIAGTQYAVDSNGDDMLIASNNIFEGNQDIGCAIQARSMYGGSATFGGSIIVSGNISRKNQGHGIAIEAYGSGGDGSPVKSVVISGNLSDSDNYQMGLGYAAGGITSSYVATDVVISNNVIRNAGFYGIVLSGYANINIANNIIDGFGVAASSGTPVGLFSYNDGGNPTKSQHIAISQNTILGGASTTTGSIGVAMSGATQIYASGIRVSGTKALTATFLEGAGIYLEADEIVQADQLYVANAAGDGIYIGTGKDASLSNFTIQNYGTSSISSGSFHGVWMNRSPAGTFRSISVANGQIFGGRGRSSPTRGLLMAPFTTAKVSSVVIDGASYVADPASGIGLSCYAEECSIKGSTVYNSDGMGIYVDGGYKFFDVTDNTVYNNGRAASAPIRTGILIGPGTNHFGTITGNRAFDNQGSPTQQYGIEVSNAASERTLVYGNSASGNAIAPFNGETLFSGNSVWGNDFYGTKNLTLNLSTLATLTPADIGNLPACDATRIGTVSSVNNSTTAVWGATATAGGSLKVVVFCNGANWTVMGK